MATDMTELPDQHDDRPGTSAGPDEAGWTFLSNHSHVLLCLAVNPEMRLREVADRVGITERAVQRIVADLEQGGYLTRVRSGRCNRYEIHPNRPLRHPVEAHRTVADLIALVRQQPEEADRPTEAGPTRPAGPPPTDQNKNR